MSVSDLNEASISVLFEEYVRNPDILMIGTTVATGTYALLADRL